MYIELSAHQKGVFERVVEELQQPSSIVVMKGFAGTGKTTILKQIAEAVRLSVNAYPLIVAPTGKAARRVSEVTGYTACTIHSLIYVPEKQVNGKVKWIKKDSIPPLPVLVDEASMVSEKIYNDLVSLVTVSGASILFVGDGFQLPPVEGDFNILKDARHELTEIHRQAKDSPIVKASAALREKKKALALLEAMPRREVVDSFDYANDELIVCLSNKDRVKYNMFIREKLYGEKVQESLQVGDRIVVLRNNNACGMSNGDLLTIRSVSKTPGGSYICEFVERPEGAVYTVAYECFNVDKPDLESIAELKAKDVLFADYGYALTCHKAQGSQFRKVYVLDPKWLKRKDADYYYRWMYTAVTRAIDKAVIIY